MGRTGWLIPVAVGVLVATVGCSSTSNKSKANDQQGSRASTVAASAAATEMPAATAAAARPTSAAHIATATSGGSGTLGGATGSSGTAAAKPAGDLVSPDCFKSVSAFKYDLTFKIDVKQNGTATPDPSFDLASLLGNIHVVGAFQSPDRTQAQFQVLGQNVQTITIGSDTWTKQGNGPWQKGDSSADLAASFTPNDLCQQSLSGLSATGVKPTSEKLDGQNVSHYRFDRNALARFQDVFGTLGGNGGNDQLPADASLEVWVTDKERLPVKMLLHGSQDSAEASYTIDLDFTITDLNGKDIVIQPPQ